MNFRSAVVIITLIAASNAQDNLSLPAALDTALGTHPEIQAMRSQIDRARGARRQAGLAPNPQLILQTENIRRSTSSNPFSFSQQTDNFVYLQQQFEPGTKRTRRVDAAQAAMAVLEQDLESARLGIAARVKDAYWAAAGAQQVLDLAKGQGGARGAAL